jgi:hypothetical protein
MVDIRTSEVGAGPLLLISVRLCVNCVNTWDTFELYVSMYACVCIYIYIYVCICLYCEAVFTNERDIRLCITILITNMPMYVLICCLSLCLSLKPS